MEISARYVFFRVGAGSDRILLQGNILVSDSGVPCLTDFGLSRSLGDAIGMTTSSDAAGSLRWMAPEIFRYDKVGKVSDVWAYGMTVLVS